MVKALGSLRSAMTAVALLLSFPLAAQTFPTKPVRMVVPYSVGVGPDVAIRAISDRLSKAWNQPVIIDNRPGAGGIVGMSEWNRAQPDGHTLFVADNGVLTVNQHIYSKLPYDPIKNFAPISQLIKSTFLVWTSTASRFKSIGDLVREAKARPKVITYASLGMTHQIHVENFAMQMGVELTPVPFKDGGQFISSVIAGETDFLLYTMNSAGGQYKAGKLRPLAVGSKNRLSGYPDIPTLVEAGGPAIEMTPWVALLALAGTPAAVIERIHADVVAAMQAPEVRTRLEGIGFEVVASSPQQLSAIINAESEQNRAVVKAANLKVE